MVSPPKLQIAFECTNQIMLFTNAFHQLPNGCVPKSEQEFSELSQAEPQPNYLIANECKNLLEKQDIMVLVLTSWDYINFVQGSDYSLDMLYTFENPLNKGNAPGEVKNTAQLTWDEWQLRLAPATLNRFDRKDQGRTVVRNTDHLLSVSVPQSLRELLVPSQPEFQPEYFVASKPSTYVEKKQAQLKLMKNCIETASTTYWRNFDIALLSLPFSTTNDLQNVSPCLEVTLFGNRSVCYTQPKLMKTYVEIASTRRWRKFDLTIFLLPCAIRRDLKDSSPGLDVVPLRNNNLLCVMENVIQKQQLTGRPSLHFWAPPYSPHEQENKDDEELSCVESRDYKCTERQHLKSLEVTRPFVHSGTECVEQGDFQQSSKLPAIYPHLTVKLVGALQEAVSSDTVDDRDMCKRILGLLLSELSVRGCHSEAYHTSYNTEHLTVYVMSRQPLRKITGALEGLAVAPAEERASTAHSLELFRLISFEKWPYIGQMSTLKFSLAGFSYAGAGDTVICCSCGLSLRGWTALTQPLDIHRQRCEGRCQLIGDPAFSSNLPLSRAADAWLFSHDEASRAASLSATMEGTGVAAAESSSSSAATPGYQSIFQGFTSNSVSPPGSDGFLQRSGMLSFLKDPTTIPRSSEREMFDADLRNQRQREELFNFESYRLRSYNGKWQHGHIVQPRELARSGFHYTGPGDRVQCAFCQGALRNWEEGDKPEELHAKHFNYCRLVQGHDVGNVPIPFWPLAEATDTITGEASHAQGVAAPEGLGIFSSVPTQVDFAVETRRLSTFATWPPSHPVRADSLAQAGFFFTGHEDGVTCFFCSGTVSAWKADSDPWREHARRFPTCPYVLQVKGRHFVEQLSTLTGPASGSSTQRTSFAVDPREIRARMDTPCVRVILKMDYPAELVREVIQRRLSTIGRDHETSEELLADIFSFHDEKQRSTRAASDTKAAPVTPIVVSQPSVAATASLGYSDGILVATAASAPAVGESSFTSGTVPVGASTSIATHRQPPDEENRQLKTQLTCKICMDAVVGIIYLPCGHLVSCPACAPALNSCPICRVSIRGTARVTF